MTNTMTGRPLLAASMNQATQIPASAMAGERAGLLNTTTTTHGENRAALGALMPRVAVGLMAKNKKACAQMRLVATLAPVGLHTQHGWRTTHPQAAKRQSEICTISPRFWHHAEGLAIFGGMDREPKKTPPLRRYFVRCCVAATLSALSVLRQGIFSMLFTFLALPKQCTNGNATAPRKIALFAQNEANARALLPSMRLVFVSRIPNGGLFA